MRNTNPAAPKTHEQQFAVLNDYADGRAQQTLQRHHVDDGVQQRHLSNQQQPAAAGSSRQQQQQQL